MPSCFKSIVKVVYSDEHHRHDPPSEFVRDGMYPYSESPARAAAILDALRQEGCGEIIPPQEHPLDSIRAVHDEDYLHYLEHIYPAWAEAGRPETGVIPETFASPEMSSRPRQLLRQPGFFCFDAQTPIVRHTHAAALASTHCALTAADQLLAGATAAYALCRPPGHHAGRASYGGYCFLNNAAVAAAHLGRRGRVAVLDIDYHHGNGTQDIFYDSGRTLFVSIHADPNRAYPFFSGYAAEVGKGDGRGFNLNYPLPAGVDDRRYLQVLDQALEEIGSFRPGWLVVSAGVDTCGLDPLGDFRLSVDGFRQVGRDIAALNLPTLLVQEGGYNLACIGASVLNLVRAFE